MDISKAFDSVSQELLSKHAHLGLSPPTVSWFKSYISDRSHTTQVVDSYSLLGFPCSGMLQGSILGPTLFSAFINNVPSVLPPEATVLLTDNTTIFIISDNLPSLNYTLQLSLDLANMWLEKIV